MFTRENKSKQIDEVSEQFKNAQGSFVVEFNKMNAKKMTDFRTRLRSKNAQVKVMRNTLVSRALELHTELKEAYKGSLRGSNVFVFALGDVSETAKVLSEFAEDIETLKLKKGVVGEEVLNAKEIKQLAKLPSLDVLRAQLLSVLMGPASKFVRTLNEVPSSFVRVLHSQSQKK